MTARFSIVSSAIDVSALTALVAHAGAGAVVTFAGDVRAENDGRAVTLLEYEAYASMAVAEMERIAEEIAVAIPVARLAVHHRVGALHVGDTAIVCVASAPHRAEAFDACRRLIDEIKARVPIWKREHGPDGPYWVGWEDARCSPDHGGDGHAHAGSEG